MASKCQSNILISGRSNRHPVQNYARDRERLENSTGKHHYYVSGQVEGRLLGKANLGGELFSLTEGNQFTKRKKSATTPSEIAYHAPAAFIFPTG